MIDIIRDNTIWYVIEVQPKRICMEFLHCLHLWPFFAVSVTQIYFVSTLSFSHWDDSASLCSCFRFVLLTDTDVPHFLLQRPQPRHSHPELFPRWVCDCSSALDTHPGCLPVIRRLSCSPSLPVNVIVFLKYIMRDVRWEKHRRRQWSEQRITSCLLVWRATQRWNRFSITLTSGERLAWWCL